MFNIMVITALTKNKTNGHILPTSARNITVHLLYDKLIKTLQNKSLLFNIHCRN